jgi:hypothetical protein
MLRFREKEERSPGIKVIQCSAMFNYLRSAAQEKLLLIQIVSLVCAAVQLNHEGGMSNDGTERSQYYVARAGIYAKSFSQNG